MTPRLWRAGELASWAGRSVDLKQTLAQNLPVVMIANQRSPSLGKSAPTFWRFEKLIHALHHLSRRLRENDIYSVRYVQPLRPQACRDHGNARRHRLQNLQAGTATSSQRHHDDECGAI